MEGMVTSSGMGEPSIYHALVVIFLGKKISLVYLHNSYINENKYQIVIINYCFLIILFLEANQFFILILSI